MSLITNKCLKICEELVKKCIISDKNILSYFPVTLHDNKGDIDFNISTEKDEYKFAIKLFENEDDCQCKLNENIDQYPKFCIEDENILMEIRDIAIMGYTSREIEEVSMLHLKSVLKYLAFSHSKDFGEECNQPNHSLNRNVYKRNQKILFDLTEMTNSINIDIDLFKEGVEKLTVSSEALLKSNKNNVFVRSKMLQSKLFFKSIGNQSMECKIVNVAPEKYLPLVYDVLLAIFYFSDKNIRQYHFHELLEYYYKTLETNLHNTDLDLSTILPRETYTTQVKTFLPFIKLDMTYRYSQELLQKTKNEDDADSKIYIRNFLVSNSKYENLISSMVLEVYDCILYPNVSIEDCYKIIRNKIGTCEYEFLSWALKPVDQRSGYLGDYFKLTIHLKQNNEHKTCHLFAKFLPTTNEIFLEMATASFNKEKFFYDSFISELKSLGLGEITDFLPDCYFSRSNDVLIFEDISLMNYSSFKSSDALPYETMLIVIKQIGKLHASSFLYEEIMTEKTGHLVRIGDKYKKYTKEIQFQNEVKNNIQELITCGIDAVLKYVLDAFPDIPTKMTMETFKYNVKRMFDLLFEKVKKSDKYRNVLCQGDFWGNNILFKRNQHNEPTASYIVDYQLIRYCPPSHDLLFFLYTNTDKATRSKYMSKLIEEYYTELSNILKKYNFDLNKIYTYEEFLDSCHYMKSVGICIASLYYQFTLYPPEKIQEINSDQKRAVHVFTVDRKEIIDEMHHNELYRQRMREIIEDLYEICENDCV